MFIGKCLKMNYKVLLINVLLNGPKNNFQRLPKESKIYLLQILNSSVVNNIGIFCIEKKALKRYFAFVKSLGHLGYDTLYAYTLINDLEKILSDKKKYKIYLEKFIFDTLKDYKDENEIVTNQKLRIVQLSNHIKLLYSFSNYFMPYFDGLYMPFGKNVTKEWLENSLKFLIKNNKEDVMKYYEFINKYYENTNINLLGLAPMNVIKFSLKKV